MAAAVAGGCLGFLLWNFNPTKVFMGDTGSLFLGGAVCALTFEMCIRDRPWQELAEILSRYDEERFSKRIAQGNAAAQMCIRDRGQCCPNRIQYLHL